VISFVPTRNVGTLTELQVPTWDGKN